jgi:hypothetical protein
VFVYDCPELPYVLIPDHCLQLDGTSRSIYYCRGLLVDFAPRNGELDTTRDVEIFEEKLRDLVVDLLPEVEVTVKTWEDWSQWSASGDPVTPAR